MVRGFQRTDGGKPLEPEFVPRSFGWQQSLPDFRDYLPNSPPVMELLSDLLERPAEGPERVDLREFLPAVSDQLDVPSSTAHACVGLIEYFQRRALGDVERLSPMFLYETARRILLSQGSSGTDLRTAFKAMVQFGVPPDRYWHAHGPDGSYPDAFLYAMAQASPLRQLTYVRLDARSASGVETLEIVRAFLAAGFPIVFGFPVSSLVTRDADIPYRPAMAGVLGGQAAVAVGYDDRRLFLTRGMLLIRNSWGIGWGDNGYGWLPYAFVRERLAVDFWTVMRPDWLASGEFLRPQLAH